MGAVMIQGDQVTLSVTGVRKRGTSNAVQPADLWHLGSNTKAITATLAGVLVERDSVQWTTRVLDVFPELAAGANPQYQAITLADLLRHRAGIPAFEELDDFMVLPDFPGTILEKRAAFTAWLLQRPPARTPGQYLYSNAGYAVAAAMAERIMGKSWETLTEELVFTPLGLDGWFGWPGLAGADQPWGHLLVGLTLAPHDPHSTYVVPQLIAPAGDISLDLADYATFLRLHLDGLRGANGLLRAATIQQIHQPVGDYGFGWSVGARDGRSISVHFGSAGTFLCGAVVCAERNLAFAVIANAAHPATEAACVEVMDWIWGASAAPGLLARARAVVPACRE
jgi:CubicO group peptidase (beta-lactamase class C family)